MFGNISVSYIGKQDRSKERQWDDTALAIVRSDTRDAVDAYTLVNVSLRFKDLYKGLEIQITGYNLFDDDHKDPEPEGKIADDVLRSERSFMDRASYMF